MGRIKTMTLRIASQSDSGPVRHTVTADLYERGGIYYLRYAEPASELGSTMAIVKLEPGRIGLRRQGETEAEFTFVPGARLPGHYRNMQGRLELEIETLSLAVDWTEHGGSARWSYRLYAAEEMVGQFELLLEAEPASEFG